MLFAKVTYSAIHTSGTKFYEVIEIGNSDNANMGGIVAHYGPYKDYTSRVAITCTSMTGSKAVYGKSRTAAGLEMQKSNRGYKSEIKRDILLCSAEDIAGLQGMLAGIGLEFSESELQSMGMTEANMTFQAKPLTTAPSSAAQPKPARAGTFRGSLMTSVEENPIVGAW